MNGGGKRFFNTLRRLPGAAFLYFIKKVFHFAPLKNWNKVSLTATKYYVII
jgi:hypothetical protein